MITLPNLEEMERVAQEYAEAAAFYKREGPLTIHGGANYHRYLAAASAINAIFTPEAILSLLSVLREAERALEPFKRVIEEPADLIDVPDATSVWMEAHGCIGLGSLEVGDLRRASLVHAKLKGEGR